MSNLHRRFSLCLGCKNYPPSGEAPNPPLVWGSYQAQINLNLNLNL
jgi:hypothetical protein